MSNYKRARDLEPPERKVLTVRIKPSDKQILEEKALEAGLEAGTAARQLIEMICAHMARGADYIDTLSAIKNTLRPTVRVPAGRAP